MATCFRWAEADLLVSQLAAAAAASTSGGIHMSGDLIGDPDGEYATAMELYAEQCIAQGMLGRALDLLESLFAKCYLQQLTLRLPSLLLSMAKVVSLANSPVQALPYVLCCASLSNSLHLHLMRASAMVSLADLWMKIGGDSEEHAREALGMPLFVGIISSATIRCLRQDIGLVVEMLNSVRPIVLGNGELPLRGRMELLAARCHLQIFSHSELKSCSQEVAQHD